MRLQFWGATKTVTGSCYLLELPSTKLLIDCGMFQGIKELRELNRADFPFDPQKIDFLLLTHSHIDHSGLVPRLCKSGFRGKILTTDATRDLCGIMLPDSGHIQELEAQWHSRKGGRAGEPEIGPLYTAEEAMKSLEFFSGVPRDDTMNLNSEVSVRFRDAGHILGSAIIELWVNLPKSINGRPSRRKLVFSGDLGNINQPIIKDPAFISEADYLIIESTYGNSIHEDRLTKVDKLKDIVLRTLSRGGNVIIPAFAIARTQDVLYELALLMSRGEVPPLKVFIDSPLAAAATEIFDRYTDYYDVETRELLKSGHDPFSFDGLTFIRSTEESKALNEIKSGAIILSASGMCDFGRIKHHLKHNLWRPECTVLFVGFQARGTLGRRLQEGEKKVTIFNEEIAVKAEIQSIDGFSAHADRDGLLYWVKNYTRLPQEIFVVHGEEEIAGEFAGTLRDALGVWTHVPDRGDSVDIETGEITYREGTADVLRERAELLRRSEEIMSLMATLGKRLSEWKSGQDPKALALVNRKLADLIQEAKALVG